MSHRCAARLNDGQFRQGIHDVVHGRKVGLGCAMEEDSTIPRLVAFDGAVGIGRWRECQPDAVSPRPMRRSVGHT